MPAGAEVAMSWSGVRELLRETADRAADYLESLPERPVGKPVPVEAVRAALGGDLPEAGESPEKVVERLVRRADPGIVATSGPRYFGFVIGGSLPAALAADWLTSAWDQNAGLYVISPADAVCEETAGRWIADLVGLPPSVSVGFVTGCQAASFAGIAAARHALLERCGWDVERRGLYGAPEIEVVVGAEAHVTIHTALQMLGLGRDRVHRVAVDGQGRMRVEALAETLAGLAGRPILVCAQAGNVNTGAFDPLGEIAAVAHAHDAWLHVDAAFGLWVGASPRLRSLTTGVELADSWSTDAHKWLNVPYDSGIVFCAHRDAHRAALAITAAYLVHSDGAERDPFEWVPEFSRRARGFAVWAALRSLGRAGVADLVERSCAHARRFAERLAGEPGVEILNEVVANQVLVRFHPAQSDDAPAADELTRETIRRIQEDGTCWLGGTTWRERAAMRISVSNWSTTTADVDRSTEAILRAFRAARLAAPVAASR
jgi:glutamate/tyrosine decarboxylase-like PLP-dependent enzyme